MTPDLEFSNVAKSYGTRSVVRDATFTARAGEVLGLIGPNGAGKTTMLRIAVGLLTPDLGAVTVAGIPVRDALARLSVAYFAGGATLPPAVRSWDWERLFGETGHPDRRRIRVLSRGNRQMLGLHAIFGRPGSPDLVVLDEPWEGLDPVASRWLTLKLRASRAAGATVLVSSHRLHELAEICDRCAFLVDGRVTMVEAVSPDTGGTATAAALLDAFDALRQIP